MMNSQFPRSITCVLASFAGLMLIHTATSFGSENQESGGQPPSSQTKGALSSSEKISTEWKVVGDCLVAGDSDCVLGHLDRIIKDDPEAWEAYALRARVREETGDLAGAEDDRRTLENVGGIYTAIENQISQAIDAHPDSQELLWQRAVHRWSAGNDVEGALSDLDRVVEMSGGTASQEVHMMRAKLRYVRGDIDGAILDYSAVIEMESGSKKTALTERARLYGVVGREDDANLDHEILQEIHQSERDDLVKKTSERIEAHPEDIMSLYLRGMELADRDDLGAALKDAETIMRVAPDSWMGYSLRSKVRRKQGDFEGYREDRAMVKQLSETRDPE